MLATSCHGARRRRAIERVINLLAGDWPLHGVRAALGCGSFVLWSRTQRGDRLAGESSGGVTLASRAWNASPGVGRRRQKFVCGEGSAASRDTTAASARLEAMHSQGVVPKCCLKTREKCAWLVKPYLYATLEMRCLAAEVSSARAFRSRRSRM